MTPPERNPSTPSRTGAGQGISAPPDRPGARGAGAEGSAGTIASAAGGVAAPVVGTGAVSEVAAGAEAVSGAGASTARGVAAASEEDSVGNRPRVLSPSGFLICRPAVAHQPADFLA